jgi:carboxyl-terminal processing protease
MIRKRLLAGLIVLALAPSAAPTHAASSETYRQLNLFGDVFERVRNEYVEEVTDEQLIESAIKGMLTSLDPHSNYLNAKAFKDMQVQTRGEFGGLGIEVTMENGVVKVVSPIDETPAARAGLQPNDLITHIDGEQVLGLNLNEAVERMRGPVDSEIVVTIVRDGVEQPFDVTIVRDIIRIQSVRYRVEENVAYLRITSFNEQTESGLYRGMEEMRDELGDELQGVVIDLRNNPGGLLDQSVAVANAFLDQGEIVSTRGRRNESTQRYNAREGDVAEGLPIVILINGGSASASEIVAGALQDHRRAVVLGTRSFGKGSVQTIIPLPGNGAMRLTTARYYTPSGRSIQAKGIEPDILVEQVTLQQPESGVQGRSEADLRGHLEGDGEAAPDEGAAAEEPPAADETPSDESVEAPEDDSETGARTETASQDYQLQRALDLIKGVTLFEHKV